MALSPFLDSSWPDLVHAKASDAIWEAKPSGLQPCLEGLGQPSMYRLELLRGLQILMFLCSVVEEAVDRR